MIAACAVTRSASRALAPVVGLLAVSACACVAAPALALAPSALIPPQLQALEQKMEQLQINSERFSEVSHGFALGSPNGSTSGKPEHVIRTSLNGSALGEASVSPAEGRLFIDGRRRPSLIAIGSVTYRYRGPGKHSPRRRPWVRSQSPHESPVAQLLSMHGGGPLEVDAGGTGPFAGLINLLTTAVGPVSVDGAVSVQGQPTTELTAAVEPRLLIKGITAEDIVGFNSDAPIETLHVFLTESGLPIRVVGFVQTQDLKTTTTVEILAVNIPVHVKPPPAGQIVAASKLRG
ncbi:MAG: hypothetical protein ACYDHN_11280 [Solirubrobacteraceae bacterium]